MVTIKRTGLNLVTDLFQIPATGSSNVFIKFTDDTDDYTSHTKEMYVEYMKDEKIIEEKCTSASGGFTVSVNPFTHSGYISISLRLIKNSEVIVTNPLTLKINHALDYTSVIPTPEAEWKQFVRDFVLSETSVIRQDLENEVNTFEEYVNRKVENVENYVSGFGAEQQTQNRRIDALEKITKGQLYDLYTSESEDYEKNNPSGTIDGSNAQINMIGGKSVAFNQLSGDFVNKQIKYISGLTINSLSKNYAEFKTTEPYWACRFGFGSTVYKDHVYYISFESKSNTTGNILGRCWTASWTGGVELTNEWKTINIVFKYTNSTLSAPDFPFGFDTSGANSGEIIYVKNCIFIDLTQMFGSGNEPDLQTCKNIFSADNYTYNEGEIVSAKVDSVVSKGANLINPSSLVVGSITGTGSEMYGGSRIRSGFFKVRPNTSYNALVLGGILIYEIHEYDFNKNWILFTPVNATYINDFKTKPNTEYIRCLYRFPDNRNCNVEDAKNSMFIDSSMGNVYIPYFKKELNLTDFLNLDGYGDSAGDVYNYVDFTPVVYKNMKSVDLGDLDWFYNEGSETFRVNIPPKFINGQNIITTKYPNIGRVVGDSGAKNNAPDKSFCYHDDGIIQRLHIKDSQFGTDVSAFKESLKGVIMHYEAESGGEDYEAYLYHKKVGKVDLGSLDYSYNTSYQSFISYSLSDKATSSNSICGKYEQIVDWGTFTSKDKSYWSASKSIYIKDLSFEGNLQSFKNAVSTVMLYYELETERVFDVTDIVKNFVKYIPVENGGTITFHQQNDSLHLPVPNSETYAIKLSEV